jgi:hypothetical protein
MKKNLLITLILIILLLIVGGVLVIFKLQIKKIVQEKPKFEQLTPGHPYGQKYRLSQEEKKELGIDSNLPVFGETIKGGEGSLGPIQVLKVEKPEINDQDQDGLSDEEEKALGTDPLKRDTDEDGLDDKDEPKWGTDPLNPDTDGDGFLDGQEIKAGYNPLGTGEI